MTAAERDYDPLLIPPRRKTPPNSGFTVAVPNAAATVTDIAEDERSYEVIALARSYAKGGLHVFPTVARNIPGRSAKAPVPGCDWTNASNDPQTVTEEFMFAAMAYGAESVGIGWAQGLDGYLAVDDDYGLPDEMAAVLDTEAVNVTARGRHLIYKCPEGIRPGNSTERFPKRDDGRTWGDVRGARGYIVIAAPDRPGLNVNVLQHARPFPRPEWLTPAGEKGATATSAEVEAFVAEHTRATRHDLSERIVAKYLARCKAHGHHTSARAGARDIAQCAAAGLINAAEAFKALGDAYVRSVPHQDRRGDWEALKAYAVGSLKPDDVEATRARFQLDTADRYSPPDDSAFADEPTPAELDALAADDDDGDELDESWQPVDVAAVLAGDLTQPLPAILRRDDGQSLFYLEAINGLHGDSGTGKGWISCYAIVQQIRRGHTVLVLDMEDTPQSYFARLRMLGARDAQLTERLIYVRPQTPFTSGAVARLRRIVAERSVRLVIIDSLGEAFGLDGVDENSDAEVGPWLRRVPRIIADDGPAVVIVDHVTKAADNPLYPSGSKRKRAAVGGASYYVSATDPLSAGKGGRIKITCAKDRHGSYAKGEHVADFVVKPDAQGSGLHVSLYAPGANDDTPPHERAARKAVACAKAEGAPLTRDALVALVGGKAVTARAGIDLAVTRGWLVESAGERAHHRQFVWAMDPPDAP